MWKPAYEMLFFSESDSGPEGPSILRRGVKQSYLHFKSSLVSQCGRLIGGDCGYPEAMPG